MQAREGQGKRKRREITFGQDREIVGVVNETTVFFFVELLSSCSPIVHMGTLRTVYLPMI